MEYRRRRPQAGQPIEIHTDTTHEEQNAAPEAPQAGVTAGRRRRAQSALGETPQAPAGETQEARRMIRPAALNGKIPKLPCQDVQVEEDGTPAGQRREMPAKKAESGERKQYTGKIPRLSAKSRQKRDDCEKPGKEKRSAAARAAEGSRTALGYAGGALLLLLMTLGTGFEAIKERISSRKSQRKSRVSEQGHALQKDEYVLEAIRPEDYHGKAHSRAEENAALDKSAKHAARYAHRKQKRIPALDMQRLLSLVFAGIAVVSACMIVSILWRTVRTNRTNRQLAELYAQTSAATPQPTAAEMVVFMPQQTPEKQLEEAESLTQQDTADVESADAGMETAYEAAQIVAPEETNAPQAEPTVVPMGKRVFHQVGGDALPQMEALHKENRDIVGWLNIENVLDLPVVYKDNSYYLTRDFYKQKNTAGTIFLDENHPFKEKTQNLLLHGHNMKDGTMFGRLIQYETDLNYVRWHPFVKFDTLWKKEEYVIFAVLRVSLDVKSDDFFNYFTHATFSSDAEFESYIRQLQLRSLYAIPVDVKPTDALLTLSTCLEDDRLVIVARRVRSGETHTQLRAVTNLTTRQ